jgi:hypothetical protein
MHSHFKPRPLSLTLEDSRPGPFPSLLCLLSALVFLRPIRGLVPLNLRFRRCFQAKHQTQKQSASKGSEYDKAHEYWRQKVDESARSLGPWCRARFSSKDVADRQIGKTCGDSAKRVLREHQDRSKHCKNPITLVDVMKAISLPSIFRQGSPEQGRRKDNKRRPNPYSINFHVCPNVAVEKPSAAYHSTGAQQSGKATRRRHDSGTRIHSRPG